jgi:oligo-1,6-glucosidase/alpha-glucosidase
MSSKIPWWKKTTVYQIFPKSFKDTNEDGIGDLSGIKEKLDYVESLGVETIWLNPIFSSPDKDAGYDISNYRKISPQFGDMKICRELIKDIHSRNMKIIFDMVLNHTSDQHPWFLESKSSLDNPKRDWYIWKDGTKPGGKKPPNNWRSLLSGKTGWHYDKTTDQWYWAHFFSFQPDLNYWNSKVREVMLDIMRFWLDEGVDGFRLDFINGLFHDAEFRDNPFKFKIIPSSLAPEKLFQGSKYTLDRPETLSFVKKLRTIVDEYEPPRFLIGEATTSPNILRKYCGENEYDGLHMVFLFGSLGIPLKALAIRRMIEEYEYVFPDPYIPTWVFSTHDRMRRITRLLNNINKAKINAILQMTARGVPFIYYGEEIGMPQHYLPIENSHDPVADNFKWIPQFLLKLARKYFHESVNRDECRTPMQWDDSPNAGFCAPSVKPWVPLTPTSALINVKNKLNDHHSLLNVYTKLLEIRKNYQALHFGNFSFIDWTKSPKELLAYKRTTPKDKNYSQIEIYLNLSNKKLNFSPPKASRNFIYSIKIGTNPIQKDKIFLLPYEGIIVEVQV